VKLVINPKCGGFSLSRKAFLRLRAVGNKYALEEVDYGEPYPDGSGVRQTMSDWMSSKGHAVENSEETNRRWDAFLRDIPRDDPDLIKAVEELGDEASGATASLKIIEIPDGVDWTIQEYDGYEWVAERHRTWRYSE